MAIPPTVETYEKSLYALALVESVLLGNKETSQLLYDGQVSDTDLISGLIYSMVHALAESGKQTGRTVEEVIFTIRNQMMQQLSRAE